jgi:hypothetical protein
VVLGHASLRNLPGKVSFQLFFSSHYLFLHTFPVELRATIGNATSQLIELLSDNDNNIRNAGAYLIVKLAKQGVFPDILQFDLTYIHFKLNYVL